MGVAAGVKGSRALGIHIVEESPDTLAAYSSISIAFRVESRFRVEALDRGLGGIRLIEEHVDPPYVKDYDAIRGEGPTRWAKRWELSNWGVLAAFDGDARVGGAAVAWNTPGLDMLGGQRDIAALWDIRVAPEGRGSGIGSALFERAAAWARARGCRAMTIETQNINVPACRFYARHGCELAAINRFAYPDIPDEVQLVWRLEL
jgi:ribosomal protein S18 acetylase RimI-like enzyme